MKKWKVVLYIIIGILLIPILLLLSPVLLIVHFKEKKTEKQQIKQAEQIWDDRMRRNRAKQFSIPYIEPTNPMQDDVFIERIGEFTCLQYWSCNDYTGIVTARELIASEHPELKERVLFFLQEHPIVKLLHGERDCGGCDLDRWKIRFIFEESDLNRSISGYGYTETTYPYLSKMLSYLPRILSKEEQDEEEWQKMILMMHMEKYKNQE